MKVEVKSKKENPLLERVELTAEAVGFSATPARTELIAELAKTLGVHKDRIYVEKVDARYGRKTAVVTAHVYTSADVLKQVVHPKRMLREVKKVKKAE